MNDFALIVPVLDGEFAATLREDGTLAIEMSDATLWCERTGDAPEAPVAEPTAEPTAEPMPEPAVPEAPAAQGGAGIEIGKKYVMTDADVNGYNMSAAQLGGYGIFRAAQRGRHGGFRHGGREYPGLTWAYGKVPTDAGEADGVVMDYYTQALNLVPTAQGFDMDYFGSMMMHFAPEGI